MATFIVLGHFTEQGMRTIRDTTTRADGVREMGRKFGVQVKDIFWTIGEYDIVTIAEAADAASATAFCLAIGQAGNVRTEMLPAFNRDEMKAIVARVATAREPVPA